MRLLLERDLPQFGVQVAAPTLQRFWRMVANCHSQLTNMSQLAASMGISVPTVGRYLDLLEAARMLRRLQPMITTFVVDVLLKMNPQVNLFIKTVKNHTSTNKIGL